MTQKIKIAHSPDTDDIFMFAALKTGKLTHPEFEFEIISEDIETLNQKAHEEIYDITAISIHAYAHLADKYALLSSGASMAEKDWGPILVAKENFLLSDLKNKKIAVPGKETTAYLFLKMMLPHFEPLVLRPEKILNAVRSNQVQAGLLIHEGQIQYQEFGFFCIAKIIDTWRKIAKDLPLPLGGSAIKKSLGQNVMKKLSDLQRQSIDYGHENFAATKKYVMGVNPVLKSGDVDRYLSWYVNDRTLNFGEEGKKALEILFQTAFAKGLLPKLVDIEIV